MDPEPYVHKLLKADGSVQDYPPAASKYTLEEMQAAVGGYIEIVNLGSGHLMVLNEEGKLGGGMPRNNLATELYGVPRDHIVGNALVCRNRDIS
jgi:hypothetical protein